MRNSIFLVVLLVSTFSNAALQVDVLGEGAQRFQTMTWSAQKPTEHTVILLSGPNDHWNSDAAWWVALAPVLSKEFNVLAIERPAIALGSEAPQLGYVAFAKQVNIAIEHFALKQFSILAFASSNMTVLRLLDDNPSLSPVKVVLVDPDVLTDFSVARYQADAKPFKDNLQKYTEYLSEGKYIARVQQKNAAELALINTLAPNLSEQQKSELQAIFERRELIPNQVNLFKEIAMYGEDLDAAKTLSWPETLPLVIIDTDFEQGYINRNDDAEAIEGLQKWRKDAFKHYKHLTQGKHKKLLSLETQEHLVMMEQPELFLKLLRE